MSLTPERWQRARDLLHEAMQMDEAQRSAFLDRQCASDPSLRAELNELLAAEGEIGSSFLENPAVVHAAVHTDTSASGTVLASGAKLGPYVVLSLIGAGGMGEVYRARDASLKRDVAIKVLPASLTRDPDRLRRFQLEAQAAAALNHPNILSIFHIGQQDGSPYIVTELLEGETLRERLRHGALKLRDATDIAIQTAKGLAAAHEKGIAHRDLKPENLFLAKDGRVKILDFGLAKLMQNPTGSDEPTVSLRDGTDPGRVLGTAGYMSPEQVRGEPADTRSDIFSLGCVLYEMLTGKRAFRKPTSVETMHAILNEDPPAASDIARTIPPALERVVHRCLEKSPDRRFQSASDLAFALDALSGSGAAESGAQKTRAQAPGSRRRIALVTTASGIALVIAAVAYLWFRPEPVPKVSNYVQLTHDGKGKSLVGTDGSRLYLNFQGISQLPVIGGEPVRIPTPSPQMWAVDVSPDGSRLLLVEGSHNLWKGSLLWSVPVLGGSPRRLGDTVGQYSAWSPDGRMLAFCNEKDLLVAKADGTEPRKVTTMQDRIQDVTWSPKGSEVQFVTGQDEIPKSWIVWQVSLDGKNLHQLLPGWTNSDATCCGRWTTDGKYLVFPSNGQLWALPQESGFLHLRRPKPVQLTSSPMMLDRPIPSRDGKKVFVVGRTSQGELMRYDVKSSRFEPFLGGISAEFLDYSRDGRSLIYVSYPEGTLWRAKADGSERLQLTYPPMHIVLPRLSPDGKQIVFFDLDPNRPAKLFEVSIEGGTPRQLLPDDPSFQADPTWSPEGNRIAFSGASDDTSSAVRILDLANRQVSILPGSQGFCGPRWSPNGRYIVAQTSDGETLMLFDFQTQKWTKLAKGAQVGWQEWSKKGDYVYLFRILAPGALFRLRLSDQKIEQVAALSFGTTGLYGSWLGLAPDDSPLLLRHRGTSDIYSLDWEEQ
jgi:eukaryotic-like serine/threonine-protein kinase